MMTLALALILALERTRMMPLLPDSVVKFMGGSLASFRRIARCILARITTRFYMRRGKSMARSPNVVLMLPGHTGTH